MILCDGNGGFLERFTGTLSVKPRRGHEAIDGTTDDPFDQRSTLRDPLPCLGTRKTQELSFACRHEARAEAVGGADVVRLVAVSEAMEEHLNALVRPGPK